MSDNEVAVSETINQTKRGRGRPKKLVTNNNVTNGTNGTNGSLDTTNGVSNETKQTSKRGRKPNPQISESLSSNTSNATKAKRGRGRPPKSGSKKGATKTAKGTRGRPKKVENVVEEVAPIDDNIEDNPDFDASNEEEDE